MAKPATVSQIQNYKRTTKSIRDETFVLKLKYAGYIVAGGYTFSLLFHKYNNVNCFSSLIKFEFLIEKNDMYHKQKGFFSAAVYVS